MTFGVVRRSAAFGLAVSPLLVSAAQAKPASASSLKFDTIFTGKQEPAWLHARVAFVSAGQDHRLELWRDHDRVIKRATDNAIVTFAAREKSGAGYQMAILDLKKRIRTDIGRTNLYRIGSFTDWFDLGHGLRHPLGTYQLKLATGPTPAVKPARACTWYSLTQQGHSSLICWSAADHFPMAIVAPDKKLVWRVQSLETRAIAASTFVIRDKGFIRNNANRDIEGD